MQFGQFFYMMGVGRGAKVEAQFNLTDQPILLLIDNPKDRLDYPGSDVIIADWLGQELLHRKAAKKIIPQETLDSIRRTRDDYLKLSCRQIGELAKADQVIWVEIIDGLIPQEISDASDAAYLDVTVRVIDPKQTEDRNKVRLWPESVEGKPLHVGISGAKVMELKESKDILEELAFLMAEKIARLFHEHRLGDFESPEA